jgi:hypothetical protein
LNIQIEPILKQTSIKEAITYELHLYRFVLQSIAFSENSEEQGSLFLQGYRKKGFTRMESEGSEPDKAAFLAAARLSTSSAGSQTYI